MNAFTAFASHTSAQKKGFFITAAIAAAVAAVGSIVVSNVASMESTVVLAILMFTGLATGITARRCAIASWDYATTNALTWTGTRKWGIAWRAMVAFFVGKMIMALLIGIVSTENAATAMLIVGTAVTTGLGMLLGVQYGRTQAVAEATSSIAVDTQAGIQPTANAPVDTHASSQTAPNISVGTQANGQVAVHSSVNTQPSSQVAATNAVGTQTNTRNPTSPSAGAQVGDSNTKDGVFGKGKWGLWAGAGLVVLYLGFLGINYAKQSAPKDAATTAQDQAFLNAMSSEISVQSATPPPAPVAAPAPPSAPVAAVASESPAAAPSPTFVAESNGGEWNSSYTQGVQEYIYRQKDGFELVIDCGSDNPGISTSLTINGQQIGSQGMSGSNDAFGMIIGDHTYTNPFDTSSEVNGGANFAYFWDHLRVAKSVVLVVNNTQYNISTEGLDKLMPVSSDQTLQCKPEI